MQVARHQGRDVYAFTRERDVAGQDFARHLGARWAGASGEQPAVPLDASIIFAPVGYTTKLDSRLVRHLHSLPSLSHHM